MMRKNTFPDAVRSRMRRLYRNKRYNMHEFALLIGVPYSTINSFMNEQSNNLNLTTLCRICDGFGITVQEFFNDDLFKPENLKSQIK